MCNKLSKCLPYLSCGCYMALSQDQLIAMALNQDHLEDTETVSHLIQCIIQAWYYHNKALLFDIMQKVHSSSSELMLSIYECKTRMNYNAYHAVQTVGNNSDNDGRYQETLPNAQTIDTLFLFQDNTVLSLTILSNTQ